jgi:outer membrane biosynthesis protein TonB
LEAALDAFEGVDEEGVQETENLAREARIRSSYLGWCKENGKESDESRFPTFSSNFLTMEKFAEENEKDMVLNKFADCTQEEYKALQSAPQAAPAADALRVSAKTGDVAEDADVIAALQAVAEAEAAANAAENVPEEAPEEAPEKAPEQAPEKATEQAPEQAPEKAPEEATEKAPEEATEKAPEKAPEKAQKTPVSVVNCSSLPNESLC